MVQKSKKKTNALLFGSDPEFFATYEKDGQEYAMPPVVFRTERGVPFEENGRHPIFARFGDTVVHEDGCAFEMATAPSNDWRSMWNTLKDARLAFNRDFLSKYPDLCSGELKSIPTVGFDTQRWKGSGDEFFMATTFGCDPDEDVYNLRTKCHVLDASKHGERYAGGHIHLSGIQEIQESPLIAIRSLVITAGIASTAFTDVPDLERKRLFLYGKPGKFRVQNYGKLYKNLPFTNTGIEYRTPSTTWTKDISIAEKIFTWAEIGIKSLLCGGLFKNIADSVEMDAVKAILEVDQGTAKDILNYIESKV